jgi:hypothetical protein
LEIKPYFYIPEELQKRRRYKNEERAKTRITGADNRIDKIHSITSQTPVLSYDQITTNPVRKAYEKRSRRSRTPGKESKFSNEAQEEGQDGRRKKENAKHLAAPAKPLHQAPKTKIINPSSIIIASTSLVPKPFPKAKTTETVTMRLFSRFRSNVESPSKQKRVSMLSSSTTSTRVVAPEEAPYYPYASLGGDHESAIYRRNCSSSNLSTTSTLQEEAKSPMQITPYEQFIAQARELEMRRQHASASVVGKRRRSAAWPQDPWRGGFGPPSSGGYRMNSYVPERVQPAGGKVVVHPRRKAEVAVELELVGGWNRMD